MKTLLLPIILLVSLIYGVFSSLEKAQTARSKERTAVRALAKSASDAEKANTAAAANITAAYDQIARGRDFLTTWQAAQARSVRGGIENTVQELASAQEIIAPTPITGTTQAYLSFKNGPIPARQTSVRADGNITGLVKFMADCERAFPLGIVQLLSIKPTDRDPKLEMELMVLDREFSPMPDLPPEAPPAESTGLLAIRPDMSRPSLPKLPDNLVTRGSGRAVQGTAGALADMSKIAPMLKVTGVIWSTTPSARILLANGYLLKPGSPLPSALVKDKGRVTLTEIGRGFARFTVETEVFNAVTSKTETEVVKREMSFTLFNDLTVEG